MRLTQFLDDEGRRSVAAWCADWQEHRRIDASSTRQLALDAYAQGRSLSTQALARATNSRVDVDTLLARRQVLVPLDHPELAHMVLAITGLTHLGGAQQRDAMHTKLESADLSDSMKMFKLGLEGGKPAPGQAGVQPEWAYKGDGSWLVPPEGTIIRPGYADGGGEEAEVVGLYVIAPDGVVLRVGFALGNEYTDHVMERKNYLYLAHSKLRPSSFGPELLTGALPEEVKGTVTIRRGAETLWREVFLSGETNMTHSIANLEAHHFKYEGFRRPGDVHVYYFGASILSFGAGVAVAAGDSLEISAPVFGAPLRQSFAQAQPTAVPVVVL